MNSYGVHHIDGIIRIEGDLWWRLIGIYGHLRAAIKVYAWLLIRYLYSLLSLP